MGKSKWRGNFVKENKRAILVHVYGNLQVPGTQEMPYPEYTQEDVAFFIGSMLPLCLVLSFSLIIPPLMKRIVHEKESGIKVSAFCFKLNL